MHTHGDFRLLVRCNLCGGELDIDEASHTTRCAHCGSVLRITRGDGTPRYIVRQDVARAEVKFIIERHLRQGGHPLVSLWESLDEVYLPFRHVSGILFSVETRPHRHLPPVPTDAEEPYPEERRNELKIVPRSVSLCANTGFPWAVQSLGMRAQTLKLTPVDEDRDSERCFLDENITEAAAQERFERSLRSVTVATAGETTQVNQHLIAVRHMLMYFPLWVAKVASASGRQTIQFDPLAKRVISVLDGWPELPSGSTTAFSKSSMVRCTPHRCPNCGVDLPAAEQAITFYCGNCFRLWHDNGEGYSPLALHIHPQTTDADSLFPFWVLPLSLHEDSTGWLSRALALLQYNTERFVVPAFDISNPIRMLRLVDHYNRDPEQLQWQDEPKRRRSGFADVVVSPALAKELVLPLVVAARAKRDFPPDDPPALAPANVEQAELVWLPFTLKHYFWRETITGATIERAAVKL